jgi:dihydropteroate synthase
VIPSTGRDSGASGPAVHCGSSWQAGRFRLTFERVRVMGIVNATPDSFSDGGRSIDDSLRWCDALVAQGADILDIGGESTRPGAVQPQPDEEMARVLPLIRHACTLGVPVSVDTSRAEVIDAALDAGADIVNDVRALRAPGALEAVARRPDVGVCLMHMQGEPGSMQHAPRYDDVVTEVTAWLRQRVLEVEAAGIGLSRIAVDPGIGFGKTHEHNLALLRHQPTLASLGRPLLIGWSRKSTLGQVTGRPIAERLGASVAAALLAAQAGAHMLRVHDVAATVDALRVWNASQTARSDVA